MPYSYPAWNYENQEAARKDPPLEPEEFAEGKTFAGKLPEPDRVLFSSITVDNLLGAFRGKLYGEASQLLYESEDGLDWDLVCDLGFNVSPLGSIWRLDDGEVLIAAPAQLYKSAGWGTNNITWTEVLEVTDPANDWFQQAWGIAIHENYVMASEYGLPKPTAKKSYLSTDYGATFTEVFDQDVDLDTTPDSNAHNHGVAIDPWHTPTRIWQITGDTPNQGYYFSDDDGDTWSSMAANDVPQNLDGERILMTTITATAEGMFVGTDSEPNGVYFIPRDSNYAAAPTMEALYVHHEGHDDLTHVCQSHLILGDWMYMIFSQASSYGSPGRSLIFSVHIPSKAVYLVYEGPDNNFETRSLFYHDGKLWGRDEYNTSEAYFVFDLSKRSDVPEVSVGTFDTGAVLGGTVHPDGRGIAVGAAADASGAQSTAVGQFAVASGDGALAIGERSEATGDYAIAIGNQFSTTATQATGTDSIAIGAQCEATQTDTVAIGDKAKATATRGVAIGDNATADGNDSVALGRDADVNGYARSVAIGNDASATQIDEVNIGPRHLAMLETDTPGNVSGGAALYILDNGGTQELRVRFADGTDKLIADDT